VDERKSVLKTFRLSESLARSLEKQAADEGITGNALANSVISEYFEWTRKSREFGFLALPRPMLISLVEKLDEKELDRIGREVLAATWKEMAQFWFQDSSPDSILRVLIMRAKFDSKLSTKVMREDGTYTVVLRHDYGPKWSIIVAGALRESVKQSFHVEPRMTRGASVITAHFKVRPTNLPS
jgi:hypothetical protein